MKDKHLERYLVITRTEGLLDSEWEYIIFAKDRAKELREKVIDCDIYVRMIE